MLETTRPPNRKLRSRTKCIYFRKLHTYTYIHKFACKSGNDISGLALATWTQANLWLRFNSAVQRKYTQIISIYTNQFLAAQDFMWISSRPFFEITFPQNSQMKVQFLVWARSSYTVLKVALHQALEQVSFFSFLPCFCLMWRPSNHLSRNLAAHLPHQQVDHYPPTLTWTSSFCLRS